MKLLIIATGYPPFLFSENLCNGKLALALQNEGIDFKVISKKDEGPSYDTEWTKPFDSLKDSLFQIEYKTGNKIERIFDVLYSGIKLDNNFTEGIRWARRAYEKALNIIKKDNIDIIITRSPNDIPHLVGYKLKKKTGIKWIANWNDPASPIWPEPYNHHLSPSKQKKSLVFIERLLRNADINTFPADSLRQHFIDNFPFLKESHTAVIPHIGLINEAWPLPAERRIKNKLLFLHSGNLSEERNPEYVFISLKRLIDDEGFKDFEFHIMGQINNYTNKLIKKYNLDNYVKFIGSHQYIKSLELMQSYDVLVVVEAKLKKGIFFASKFTDYIQASLPIFTISPSNGFARDLLENQKGHFYADNNNLNDIYETLIKIKNCWEHDNLYCNNEFLSSFIKPKNVVAKLWDLLENDIKK